MRLMVDSSMILAIEYKASENKLIVEFRRGNSVYIYQNVPNVLFLDMLESESIGKWFHANILKRPERFPYTRLPKEVTDPKDQ